MNKDNNKIFFFFCTTLKLLSLSLSISQFVCLFFSFVEHSFAIFVPLQPNTKTITNRISNQCPEEFIFEMIAKHNQLRARHADVGPLALYHSSIINDEEPMHPYSRSSNIERKKDSLSPLQLLQSRRTQKIADDIIMNGIM